MDKKSATVTMTLADYEELEAGYSGRNAYVRMFERAYKAMEENNGVPVLTKELERTIEEIYI
ncbi:hypothetical protein [Lacrimispora sp. JR3]|uniref:hypothetical protein n=1 Tax=Lacrimispora sinapis TaxID=3111456 RepID=UPI003749E01E